MSVVAAAPVSPFKGLAAFEDSELDALLFFGRERETEIIVSNLLASKLTVLYGPSGVGKSSVLRAAVARRLRELAPDAAVAVLAEWAAEPSLPSPDDEAFLLLDQFEEYFLYHDEEPLLGQLLPLLARPHVHVLIALREDTLARLDAFQARLPDVFANRLRLDHLDAVAARVAIVGPLETWNAIVPADERMGIEPALVEAVLAEVAAPEAIGSPSTGRIEAPYLQLIMERVWEEERAAGSPLLRAETLRRLGGARAIVSTHLERALAALPPRDAAIATGALRFLVTPSRTKIAHSFGDLVDYTNESPVELQAVLDRLASQRILRSIAVGGDGGRRYEIFHDVLAEPVLAWRREFETRAAVDRERAAAARRHRRLLAIAAGAAVLAAAMIALTAYAFTQRSEASKQKRVAEAKALVAVRLKLKADRQTRHAQAETKKATAAEKQLRITLKERKAALELSRANAQRAKRNELRAEALAKRDKLSTARAKHSKQIAIHAERAAKSDLRIVKDQELLTHVGELVARAAADLDIDPVRSLESALAASTLRVSNAVEDALRNALIKMHVRGILYAGGEAVDASAFSPDGALVATGAEGGQLRVFRTQTHALVYTLKAGSPVLSIAFSPDGRTLAAATHDGRVLLYDVSSGSLRTLRGGGAILDVRFAGGGRFIVGGGADKTLRIWDSATGVPVHTITFKRAVTSLAVSLDGSLVAAVLAGGPVVGVYDVANGAPAGSVEQPGEATGAAFSPNGAYLVTTGSRNAFVWDTHTWAQLHELSGHTDTITDVRFAADGRVVTASADTSARVWDPATGALLGILQGQHQQKLLAVAVSPDGKQIATASADETARIWSQPFGSTPRLLAGHTDAVTGTSFSLDGSLLLTASADGFVRLWGTSVPTLRRLGLQQGAISAVAYSPDGKLVLSAGADGTAQLRRSDGSVAHTLQQGGPVTDASFTSGGVLTAGADGSAKLWRVSDGALLATYAHGAPVRAAVATGGGVVTAGDDGFVRAWTIDGRLRWSAQHGSAITAAAASKDGTIATGAADGTVRLWRGSDGKPLFMLSGHTGAISSLAFNSSGGLLVSGSADSTARIWDTRTGMRKQTLVGHRQAITSASFSPDGKLVLTSSLDGDARLWSVETGRSVEHLKFHIAAVSQAAFSPDGRWAVTAGPTAAAIWQVRTGRLILYMHGTRGALTSTGWARDSLRIVTGDKGGGVETFTCEVCGRTPALRALARARLAALR